MDPLVIGIIAFAVSLIIVLLIAKDLIENTSNAKEKRKEEQTCTRSPIPTM
jgi:hypothetical protein